MHIDGFIETSIIRDAYQSVVFYLYKKVYHKNRFCIILKSIVWYGNGDDIRIKIDFR